MSVQRRDFLLVVTLAVATVTPASAQTVAPTVGPAQGGKTQGFLLIPVATPAHFCEVWLK